MDLKELVPQVPDIPELNINSDSKGIYVVTLQLWLKMLCYDKDPDDITDRSKLISPKGVIDTNTELAVKRLYEEEEIEASTDSLVDFAGWVAMDKKLRKKLPPNPENLDRLPFPKRKDFGSEISYNYSVMKGLEVFGFRSIIKSRSYSLEIIKYKETINGVEVEKSKGSIDNIPVAIYSMDILKSSDAIATSEEIGESEGVEVSLFDKDNQPISGRVRLVNQSPETDSLKKTIRLFKGLNHDVPVLEKKKGVEVNPKIIDNKLSDGDQRKWDAFSNTWGQFYGAPWMGVLIDPTEKGKNKIEPNDCNWANYKKIKHLYQHGMKQYDSKKKIISIKALNNRTGLPLLTDNTSFFDENIDQLGNGATYYLPSLSDDYASIDFSSTDYDAETQKHFTKSFLELEQSDYRLVLSDTTAVESQVNYEKFIAKGVLIAATHGSVKSSSGLKKETQIKLLIEKILIEGDSKKYTFPPESADIELIYQDGTNNKIDGTYSNGKIKLKLKNDKESKLKFIYIETKEGYSKVVNVFVEGKVRIMQTITITSPEVSSYAYGLPIKAIAVPGYASTTRHAHATTKLSTVIIKGEGSSSNFISLGRYGLLLLKFDFPSKSELSSNLLGNQALVIVEKEQNLNKEMSQSDFGFKIDPNYKTTHLKYQSHINHFLELRNNYFLQRFDGSKPVKKRDYIIQSNGGLRDEFRVKISQRDKEILSTRIVTEGIHVDTGDLNKDGYKPKESGNFKWIRIVDNKPDEDEPVYFPGLDVSKVTALQKKHPSFSLSIVIDISGSMGDNEEREYKGGQAKKYEDRLYAKALEALINDFITSDSSTLAELKRLRYWSFYYDINQIQQITDYKLISPKDPELIEPQVKSHNNKVVEATRKMTRAVVVDESTKKTKSIKESINPIHEKIKEDFSVKKFTDYTPLAQSIVKVADDLIATHTAGKESDLKVMIVITDGDGTEKEVKNGVTIIEDQHLGAFRSNARKLPVIPSGKGEGIIELIGYSIANPKDRLALLNFGLYEVNKWTIYVHEVEDEKELKVLLSKLKTKYGL